MIEASNKIKEMINAPVRQIKARVELLNGSTLLDVFTYADRLISFDINRTGDNKFFGFGFCQRLNVKLIDSNRDLNITTANTMEIVFGVDNEYIYTLPLFKVTEVHRDEKTNVLSITAYDSLYAATEYTMKEINLPNTYNIKTIAAHIARYLGLNLRLVVPDGDTTFNTTYTGNANLEGSETLREVLNAIAEVTQTVYFVDNYWNLVFKRIESNNAVMTISKDKYITLTNGDNRRLVGICSATELGDNVEAKLDISGTTQYLRNNPFLELREDIANIIDGALGIVGGLTIAQFDCHWRGNFLLELGDYISIEAKDGNILNTFLLNDTITYNGALSQKSGWQYADDNEAYTNPTSLGDILKETYARVDKVNKQVDIVVSDTDTLDKELSAIKLNTDSISTSVTEIKTTTDGAIEKLNSELSTLSNTVETKITSEEMVIAIQQELTNGVEKVVTSTGFTFDDSGLTIERNDSEMTTNINEDGLSVFKDNEEVLTADNTGVLAINLTSKQYLIVGNSRFEDYGSSRTGCYWIG